MCKVNAEIWQNEKFAKLTTSEKLAYLYYESRENFFDINKNIVMAETGLTWRAFLLSLISAKVIMNDGNTLGGIK